MEKLTVWGVLVLFLKTIPVPDITPAALENPRTTHIEAESLITDPDVIEWTGFL